MPVLTAGLLAGAIGGGKVAQKLVKPFKKIKKFFKRRKRKRRERRERKLANQKLFAPTPALKSSSKGGIGGAIFRAIQKKLEEEGKDLKDVTPAADKLKGIDILGDALPQIKEKLSPIQEAVFGSAPGAQPNRTAKKSTPRRKSSKGGVAGALFREAKRKLKAQGKTNEEIEKIIPSPTQGKFKTAWIIAGVLGGFGLLVAVVVAIFKRK